MNSDKKIPMTTQQIFKENSIVKTIGIVKGNTIRERHLSKDIMAGFKAMIGGEIEEYTKMMAEAREQAIDRMVADAINLGANVSSEFDSQPQPSCRVPQSLWPMAQA